MIYTIIEDCSPFYIRFTWPGLENLISLCKGYPYPPETTLGFRHLITGPVFTKLILDLTPMSKQIPLKEERVSFFMTEPGMYYGAHKDGADHRFSLNVTVSILDDKCVTSWYKEDDFKDYEISTSKFPSLGIDSNRPGTCREVLNWDKTKHTPIKSMIAEPNEAILFNTEFFHDWDNSASSNRRIVLTFRHKNASDVYFNDAKQILFGL